MTTNWDSETPSLLRAIVCYADILGFKRKTRDAFRCKKESEFLNTITLALEAAYGVVRRFAAPEKEGDPPLFEMKVFTDNVVVAFPHRNPLVELGESEFATLLILFSEVQTTLAAHGFLLRGAITEGRHYQDDNIVFGEAFLEAVAHDQSGSAPRLVVGPSLEPWILLQIENYADASAPHYDELLEDTNDQVLFINYLATAFEDFPEERINWPLLDLHKGTVLRGLREYESDQSVREKYEWLARYHNFVCHNFAERCAEQRSVALDEEDLAYIAEAQQALDYIVPLENEPEGQQFRILDEQCLLQRVQERLASD